MSIFAIRKIISHMSIVKYGEKMDAIQCATIKKLKRNIDGRMKIGGTKIFTSRVWGRHVPTRSCPGWAENFQELKIFGHGTVLVLYVFLKGLKELR